MSEVNCPGCVQRDATIEALQRRVEELERLVKDLQQGPAGTAAGGGHVTRGSTPAEIRAHAFGPRLAAVLGYLQGSHHVSHRGLEEVSEVVFGVPLSLGSVTALQEQLGEALAPAHEE